MHDDTKRAAAAGAVLTVCAVGLVWLVLDARAVIDAVVTVGVVVLLLGGALGAGRELARLGAGRELARLGAGRELAPRGEAPSAPERRQ